MRATAVVICSLAAGILLSLGVYRHAEAKGQADAAAEIAADPPVIDAPDPVEEPGGFLSAVYDLYKAGALAPAIILLAWGVVLYASRKWSRLREGKYAIYAAAALAALATLAEPASRGTTPTIAMVIAAIASAVALAMKPEPAPLPKLPKMTVVK
jgi:hypothetical protein